MSRGLPSMTALLALLAIAGYQNKDKIAEMLRGAGQNRPGDDEQGGIGGWLGQLGLGGASARRDSQWRTRGALGALQTKRPGGNRRILGQYRPQQAMHSCPT